MGKFPFGVYLSDYCRFQKIPQKRITERTGISKVRLSQFFNGHLNIGSQDFIKILHSIDINLLKILERKTQQHLFKKQRKDPENLSEAVGFVLDSLDDLGKQSCLSQILFASKLSSKRQKSKSIKIDSK